MTRVLFVSNGHGEAAIADRIAEELRTCAPGVSADHLALVGAFHSRAMRDVGPQRRLPSGGLIAMGNLRNIVRDVRGGLPALTFAQRRFLVRSRRTYAAAIAVGDVFALLMALAARARTVFVGTAKSVRVAKYGAMEERVLRRAQAVFVRDEPTADALRAHGIAAQAPGNVIVDLFASADDPAAQDAVAGFEPVLALFPGSRESAYRDAIFSLDVIRALAATHERLGAVLSVAPTLDVERMIAAAAGARWSVERRQSDVLPFVLYDGKRPLVRGWHGDVGPLLTRVQLVLGQAGTANEAAAAAGVPVAAFERADDRKTSWYRMRQRALLGEALAIVPSNCAVPRIDALLRDGRRRARMASVGRERMGAPGGARAVARAIAALAAADAR